MGPKTGTDSADGQGGYGTQNPASGGWGGVKNLLVQSSAPAFHGIENITLRQVVRNRLDGSRKSLTRRPIVGEDVHQAVRLKIADADVTQLSGAMSVLHGAPGPVDVAKGLMDQVQVDVVELQPPQRFVDGQLGALVPVSCTQSLVVTKSCSRGTLLFRMPRPTASSLR